MPHIAQLGCYCARCREAYGITDAPHPDDNVTRIIGTTRHDAPRYFVAIADPPERGYTERTFDALYDDAYEAGMIARV